MSRWPGDDGKMSEVYTADNNEWKYLSKRERYWR